MFKSMVKKNWKIDFVGDPLIEFHTKLKGVKNARAIQSKVTFGNVFQKIVTLEDDIKVKKIQMKINVTMENREELNKANVELRKFLYLEKKILKIERQYEVVYR